MSDNIESKNMLKKVIKYFLLFIVVMTSSHYIPIQQLDLSESFMIGVSAACCFAINSSFFTVHVPCSTSTAAKSRRILMWAATATQSC